MLLSMLLLLVLVSGLIWVYLRWMRVRSFWTQRGVPHNPLHPIMGSLTFLHKKNPGEWMIDLYKQFKSPYVGIWLFWRPALVINSPEISKRILVKDFDIFKDRFLSSGSSDPTGALNIFTVNDPTWSWIRRQISPMFTSLKLRSIQSLLVTKTSELVERIRKESANKNKIDTRKVYTDFTTDMISITSFGVDSDSTLTGHSAMRRVTQDFQTYSVYRGLAWASIFFFPSLVDIFRFSFFPKKTTNYFRHIFQSVVTQRGGWNNENTEPGHKDLVNLLVKIKQDAIKNNEEVSDDLLISQAAIMLLGGFETSSANLAFSTYELAHQPELQEKLYAELKELEEKFGELNTTVLSEAPYLNAVIKEVLRKYVPMGWLDRICSQDYKIDDKLTIPAGTPIYVNSIGMHWDPEYFPEPEKFDPERFLPGNEQSIVPFTFMPFGEGPRGCIGKRYAQVIVRASLAALTLNFKYRPLANAKKPSEIEFEKRGLFLLPGEILYLDFIPRN